MPDKLLEKTAPLRNEYFEKNREILEKLAKEGGKPWVLFIGCSDFMMPVEPLLGAQLGDVLTHLISGNVIPPYEKKEDMGSAAVLEYAVQHRRVSHIVVCGHIGCGFTKSSDVSGDTEHLVEWFNQYIRPLQEAVEAIGLNEMEQHQAIVERNVVQQLHHLQTYPFIVEAVLASRLELHGCVYYSPQRLCYYDSVKQEFRPQTKLAYLK